LDPEQEQKSRVVEKKGSSNNIATERRKFLYGFAAVGTLLKRNT
jgi:hypothetical protein